MDIFTSGYNITGLVASSLGFVPSLAWETPKEKIFRGSARVPAPLPQKDTWSGSFGRAGDPFAKPACHRYTANIKLVIVPQHINHNYRLFVFLSSTYNYRFTAPKPNILHHFATDPKVINRFRNSLASKLQGSRDISP